MTTVQGLHDKYPPVYRSDFELGPLATIIKHATGPAFNPLQRTFGREVLSPVDPQIPIEQERERVDASGSRVIHRISRGFGLMAVAAAFDGFGYDALNNPDSKISWMATGIGAAGLMRLHLVNLWRLSKLTNDTESKVMNARYALSSCISPKYFEHVHNSDAKLQQITESTPEPEQPTVEIKLSRKQKRKKQKRAF